MKTETCRNRLTIFVTFSLLCIGISPAKAASTWVGTTGSWTSEPNWSNATLPGYNGTAYLDNGGTALFGSGTTPGLVEINIGTTSGGSGSVNLSGGTWGATSVLVGDGGTGSLLISGGTAGSSNGLYVGYEATGTGSVVVTGGTVSNYGGMAVGIAGTGNFVIDGGVVSNTYQGVSIGSQTGSSGSVIVTSGTLESGLVGITIGGSGDGSLLVNGGFVSSPHAFLGSNFSGSGVVTVSGQGSTWRNTGSLEVGYQGSDNTLTIEDGGLVKVGDSVGETISFSTYDSGNSTNHLRVNDGYIALFGDQVSYVGSLIGAGRIQLWNGSAWVSAEAADVEVTYYNGDDAAAESATGYSDLGNYTVVTAQAVPEPGTGVLFAFGVVLFALSRKR